VKAKELGAQGASAREKKSEQKAKSRTSARRAVLKGTGLTLHLRHRARRVSKTLAHSRARPGEIATLNRDASTLATCRLAETERGLDGAVILVTSTEMPRTHDHTHVTTTTVTAPTKPPRLQQLQIQIKARE
jgi:hypothetical protein